MSTLLTASGNGDRFPYSLTQLNGGENQVVKIGCGSCSKSVDCCAEACGTCSCLWGYHS